MTAPTGTCSGVWRTSLGGRGPSPVGSGVWAVLVTGAWRGEEVCPGVGWSVPYEPVRPCRLVAQCRSSLTVRFYSVPSVTCSKGLGCSAPARIVGLLSLLSAHQLCFSCLEALMLGVYASGGEAGRDECFPGGSDSKHSACNVGDPGSTPGLGRSPGEGNGDPLQYS